MPARKRIAHFINPNRKEDQPERAIFFDTETEAAPFYGREERQMLKLGWACYWTAPSDKAQSSQEWIFFATQEEFWAFLCSHLVPGEILYLVAHNIAFDWRIVGGFEHADRSGWLLDFIYSKGQTTLIQYETGRGTLMLLDLGNFYPVSLEKIGEVVGIEKVKIDFKKCGPLELSIYCKNDVQILIAAWEAWLSFLDKHDLGDFRHTLAAQAFSAYRHNAMNFPIRVHNDGELCELERAAYRGGRTECFMIGEFPKGKYYQVDVNGMYTFCMASYDYPRLLRAKHLTMSTGRLRTLLKSYCAIARVVVSTDYPVFPMKIDRLNVYPVGVFETTLTTPELEFALEHCDILKIGEIALYEKAPIFRAYAEYFAELKDFYWKQGNKPFREIAKRFANSLYGKFGQTGIEIDLSFELPPIGAREALYFDYRVKKWYRIYEIGGRTVFEKSGGESFNSFPAIPAHVTAYARMYLWSLITRAGYENTFYCDTDSLIVNEQGYQNLAPVIDDYKLGYVKLESFGEQLEIWGPKDYRIGDKTRIKGIKKDARRLASNVFEQSKFLGLRGALRRNDPDLVTISQVKRELHREIKTGEVQPDGKVRPFRLSL